MCFTVCDHFKDNLCLFCFRDDTDINIIIKQEHFMWQTQIYADQFLFKGTVCSHTAISQVKLKLE